MSPVVKKNMQNWMETIKFVDLSEMKLSMLTN